MSVSCLQPHALAPRTHHLTPLAVGLSLKSISRFPHGDEMPRLRRIRLELVSQSRYVLIDGAGSDAEAVAPDLLHQRIAGHDVAARLDEEREEIELHRTELDRFPRA